MFNSSSGFRLRFMWNFQINYVNITTLLRALYVGLNSILAYILTLNWHLIKILLKPIIPYLSYTRSVVIVEQTKKEDINIQ